MLTSSSSSNMGTGIAFRHAFVVTLQQITCDNVGICIDLGDTGVTGSINVIDSSCSNCGVVVNGSAPALLENIKSYSSGPMLQVAGHAQLNESLESRKYVVGRVHYNNDGSAVTSQGTFLPYTERGDLAGDVGLYHTKSQPQHEDYPASSFASVEDAGAKGQWICRLSVCGASPC